MKRICMLICAVTCVLALGLVCLSGCGTKQLSESQNSSQSTQTSAQQSTSSDENTDATDEKTAAKSKTKSKSSKDTDASSDSSKKESASDTDKSSSSTATSSSKKSSTSSSKSTSKSTKSSSSSKKSGSSSSSSSNKSTAKEDANTITVSVTIDGKGFITGTTKEVTVEKGASVFDALVKVADSIGGNSKYVSSINGLAEKQHGNLSGWMYSVNGVEPNVSCGKYTLEDGDVVNWHYVNVED